MDLFDHLDDMRLEFANAKCRWAAYFGYWPEWMDAVKVPNESDVKLAYRQWNVRRNGFEWEFEKDRIANADYPTGVHE